MRRVSVVVPCYNERDTIGLLLRALERQDFSLDDLEVVIADGMSQDGTREALAAFSRGHPRLRLRVVDNPARVIPAALNRAIEAARGEVILRLDAHSMPRPDYVARCLAALDETGAANVGGAWDIQPSGEGWIARSIAAAASHPLGAGDARYRYSDRAGRVDTVPFGAFRREWLERVGPFNESLLTNEDYEYNLRIREAGGVVWYDPKISSVYFARGDLRSLARQYARYGFWKAQMIIRNPRSLRWRQALPPSFVLVTVVLAALAVFWPPGRWLLDIQLGVYAIISLATGSGVALRRKDPLLALGFPLALAVMHFSWGGAFLWGLLHAWFGGRFGSIRAKGD